MATAVGGKVSRPGSVAAGVEIRLREIRAWNGRLRIYPLIHVRFAKLRKHRFRILSQVGSLWFCSDRNLANGEPIWLCRTELLLLHAV